MGRVFFPTYRSNVLGVRDVGTFPTLGSLEGAISIPRAPAEPYPRAVNNPTGPMLGALVMADGGGWRGSVGPYVGDAPIIWGGGIPVAPGPARQAPAPVPGISSPMPGPARQPPISTLPGIAIVPAAGAPATSLPPAPPVSAQGSPTPVVTIPQQPDTGAILVTSGGGTPAPSTAPITIQTGGTDTTGAIAAWLRGSTVIFSYAIPNALLAAAVILLFALISSPGGKRR